MGARHFSQLKGSVGAIYACQFESSFHTGKVVRRVPLRLTDPPTVQRNFDKFGEVNFQKAVQDNLNALALLKVHRNTLIPTPYFGPLGMQGDKP